MAEIDLRKGPLILIKSEKIVREDSHIKKLLIRACPKRRWGGFPMPEFVGLFHQVEKSLKLVTFDNKSQLHV